MTVKAELLEELKKHVIFDRKIVADITKDDSYAGLLLHRLKKSCQIMEIERNRYTVHKDAFLIASRISWPSYISIWSALRYHNQTEQLPQTIWVVTTRKRRNSVIDFAGTEIRFITAPPKYFFGFDKVERDGFEIFVADPEKSIVDSVLFKKISVAEISLIIRTNMKSLRTTRLIDYAIRTQSGALIKRLGFILEMAGAPVGRKLDQFIGSGYLPLDPSLAPEGKLNVRWKIMENASL
jgi:predicted transcriptional regulator of viral defense system